MKKQKKFYINIQVVKNCELFRTDNKIETSEK